MSEHATAELFRDLEAEIRRFVHDRPENAMPGGGYYFDAPLMGVAAGDDPLFTEFRRVVGPFHWLPADVLASAGPATAGASVSVVCWVLPISGRVRESNRPERTFPSREWALTRSHGEAFNVLLRRHLVEWFAAQGIVAAAPQLTEGWRQVNDGPMGIASTWSERHAAYAAGLGTFSLNDGLITEQGIAHRLGSVVAAAALPPSPRNYQGLFGNCLYHRYNRCGVCIGRCPVKALSASGHDKQACMAYVYGTVPQEMGQRYGVTQTGCGLCQTAVPCEGTNPCR